MPQPFDAEFQPSESVAHESLFPRFGLILRLGRRSPAVARVRQAGFGRMRRQGSLATALGRWTHGQTL